MHNRILSIIAAIALTFLLCPDANAQREDAEFGGGSQDSTETEQSSEAESGAFECATCGNPYVDPYSFGNFVFNGVEGATPWIKDQSSYGVVRMPVYVSNPQGQIVRVFIMSLTATWIPLTSDTIAILVRLPNGVVFTYHVLRSDMGTDLPVGEDPTGGSSNEESDDGGEDTEIADESEDELDGCPGCDADDDWPDTNVTVEDLEDARPEEL